jgi:uncharacterized protein YegP (UPF0339 family)
MPKVKVNRKPGIHLHKTKASKIYADLSRSEYYWILIAKNGKTIAKSSETYKRKRGAVRSIGIAADIMTGIKPREYYDHTKKDGGNWVEF